MASITKRGESYRIKVSAGYSADGKQIVKTMTWTPPSDMTESKANKEVERQAILFEDKIKKGLYADGNIKLQDFMENRWFPDYAEKQLKRKTYGEYKKLTNRIYPVLGHIRMSKFQPQHIMDFYKYLSQPGMNKNTEGYLSQKTIKHYANILTKVFGTAVMWGIIESNPCRRVEPPKVVTKDIVIMNEEETRQFVQVLQSEPLQDRALFILLIYTGLRRGEVLALKWEDIDFKSGVVSINKQLQYTKGLGIYEETPKSKQSYRSVKVPDSVLSLLKEHKTTQTRERLKLGSAWENSGRVFTNLTGGNMGLAMPIKRLKKIQEKHGLPITTLHSLRHTSATLLINQGVNVKTVSGRLGHSQTSTTMNIYAHQLKSADAAAAEALDLMLRKEGNM